MFEPIAITYNISGVNSLKLDAPTLARIFNGGITRWDDPAIKALNPGINLPSAPIHVFFRSDQSGDTSNFQQYLDVRVGRRLGQRRRPDVQWRCR